MRNDQWSKRELAGLVCDSWPAGGGSGRGLEPFQMCSVGVHSYLISPAGAAVSRGPTMQLYKDGKIQVGSGSKTVVKQHPAMILSLALPCLEIQSSARFRMCCHRCVSFH